MAPTTAQTHAVTDQTSVKEPTKLDSTTAASSRMQNETIENSNQALWRNNNGQQTAEQHLPTVTLENPEAATNPNQPKPAEAPKLNEQTVKQTTHELYEAINGDKPDNDKIHRLLDSLNAADRKAIEDAYRNTNGNTDHRDIRTELKDNLGDEDYRKVESSLNKRDGRTNDAGNLMVSLSAMGGDRGDAERRVIETFATLNAEQQQQLKADFQQDYGKSVEDALKDAGLSDDAKKAVEFARKPVEQRTAQDIEAFAKFAIEKGNLDYFSVALRGDSPAAVEARKNLSNNEEFKKQIVEAFKVHQDGGNSGIIKNIASLIPGGEVAVVGFNFVEGLVKGDLDFDRLTEGTGFDKLRKAVESKEVDSKLLQAMDILKNGQVSLATIAADNTGTIFGWFDNKDAISNAAEHATESERKLFAQGQQLAQSGGEAKTDEEKNALSFYNKVHEAFEKAGNDNEPKKWEDRLVHGKDGSVVSQILDSKDKEGRYVAIESLSQKDWQTLKDPAAGAAFRKQIEDELKSSGNSEEAATLLKLLDKKLAAGSYEDSQKVIRSLSDLVTTSPHSKTAVATIAGMTPEEATRYKTDAAFRAQVDTFLHDKLDELGQVASSRLLAQVAETGQAPKQDAIDKLFSAKLNGVEGKDAIGDIEAVLQDSALRQKLSGNTEGLSDVERQIKTAIDEYITAATPGSQTAAYGGRGAVPAQPKENEYLQAIYQNGRLTVDQKAKLNLRGDSFFSEAATVSPEERQKLYDSGLISNEDKQLIDTLTQQGGKMTLVDELRASVIKDGTEAEAFASQLKGLSSEEKQALKDEYTRKYGSSLDEDVLAHVSDQEKNNFRTYLTAGEVDGRQDFYDNLERALHSESGYSPDGSQEVLERALNNQAAMLSDFQARYEKLPPEKQEEANQLFTAALKDYQESKEKFAEKMFQAAVIVGGVAVGVATGGVGLVALASVVAIGAAGRIALKKAIQGNDYDLTLSNALKDAAIGGATAGLSVLGPETVAAFAGVGKAAAGSFLTSAGEQVAANVIKKDASTILQRELNNVISSSVVRGEPISKEVIDGIVAKVASSTATADERAALSSVLTSTLETSGRQVTDDIMRASFAGMGRQAAAFGTVGGTANVAIEGTVGLANGHFDPSHLPQSFLVGFGLGSGMSAGLETAMRGLPKGSAPDAIPATAADGTPAPVRAEIVGQPEVQLGQPKPELAFEPLTPLPTRRGEPFVERATNAAQDRVRYWTGDGRSFELIRNGDQRWYTPARTSGPKDSPVKIHVDVESADSLKRLQQVLIPALERDPELRRLVGDWKTFNPKEGINPDPSIRWGEGQDAKAFTIYPADVQGAQQIAHRLDQILAENNLSLPRQIRHGNVDEIPAGTYSNRVGLTRDTFERSVDSSAERPIVRMDQQLQARIENKYGRQLTEQELQDVDQRLVYDSEGKLGYNASFASGSRDAYHGGVYLAEATDRRALYNLYNKFAVNPVEVAAQAENRLQSAARINGLPLTPNKVVGIGRSSDNFLSTGEQNMLVSNRHALFKVDDSGRFWIADADSTNGTWVNGQRLAPFDANGNRSWRQVSPEDNIQVGNERITLLRPNQREYFSFEPRNIEEYGSSPTFGRLVADAYGQLPQVERGLVERNNVGVVLGGDMGSLRPDLRRTPPGYPPGSSYASSTGLYDQQARKIFIPEHVMQSNGRFATHHDPAAALRHEFGHAVDHALGNFSRSQTFQQAVAADLRNSAAQPNAAMQYYRNSPEELFAELYAKARGGGLSHADVVNIHDLGISLYFPEAYKVLMNQLAALK